MEEGGTGVLIDPNLLFPSFYLSSSLKKREKKRKRNQTKVYTVRKRRRCNGPKVRLIRLVVSGDQESERIRMKKTADWICCGFRRLYT